MRCVRVLYLNQLVIAAVTPDDQADGGALDRGERGGNRGERSAPTMSPILAH